MLRQCQEPQSIPREWAVLAWRASGQHSLEYGGESCDPPAPAPAVADETAETSSVCRLLRGQRGHVTRNSPLLLQHCQPAASQGMGMMALDVPPLWSSRPPLEENLLPATNRKTKNQFQLGMPAGLSNPATQRHLGGLGGLLEDSTGKQQWRREEN